MPENLELEKQLKLAKRTGSYLVGRREVLSGIKGSKLLVWSDSSNLPQTILDQSRDLSVPAIKFSGNPVELGRACGIPFRVSVIAVKSAGDADLSAFTKSADYVSVLSGIRSLSLERMPEHPVETEKVPKEKPEKKPKEKKEAVKAAPKKKSKSEDEEPKEKEPAAGKTKEKKTKPAKKSSDASKKSKKKKADEEEQE